MLLQSAAQRSVKKERSGSLSAMWSSQGPANMRQWTQQLIVAVLVIFLGTIPYSSGQEKIYIVTGVHGGTWPRPPYFRYSRLGGQVEYFDGVYQKTADKDFFVKTGFRPKSTNFFIYNVTQDKMASWALGVSSKEHLCDTSAIKNPVTVKTPQPYTTPAKAWRNEERCRNGVNYTRTFEDYARAVFKGIQTSVINKTTWMLTYDGTQNGYPVVAKNAWEAKILEAEIVPRLWVYPITAKLSGDELLEQGGIEIDQGVLCAAPITRKWLFVEKFRPGKGIKKCDRPEVKDKEKCKSDIFEANRKSNLLRCVSDCVCMNCWDKAHCQGVASFSVERVLSEQRLESDNGFFCANQEGSWVYLGNNETQICDNKCLCKSCWDEDGCGNTSREQLVDEKGMEIEDGVTCEISTNRWDVIRTEDRRTCDLKCDCKTCWDETRCPWTVQRNGVNITRLQIKEVASSAVSLASLVFDTTVVALESQAGLFTGRGVFCRLGKNDQWQHILKTDWEFCNFVCDCHQCHDELHCPWVQDRSGEQKQILEAQNRLEMVSVIFNKTKKQLKEKGGVITSKNVFCLEKGTEEWIYFDRDSQHPFHCNLVDDCVEGVDEEGCNFFITEVSGTEFNISKEARTGRRGMRITQRNQKGPERLYGVLCENEAGEWIHIGESDPSWCNVRYDCLTGLDEQFCPWFQSTSIEIPIYSTLIMFLLGVVLFLIFTFGQSKQVENSDPSEAEVNEVMDQVDFLITSITDPSTSKSNFALPDSKKREQAFDVVHKTPGGMRLLLGSAFNFVIDPTDRHNIAEFIQREEEKIHPGGKQDWMTCIRIKSGNDSATQEFLDSLDKPGIITKCRSKLKKLYIWTTGTHHQGTLTRWRRVWIKSKVMLIIGIFPLLKAAFYILDYVKDFCLFLFLYHRMDFIHEDCSLLKGLIIFHGTTIMVSGLITGISIQLDNDIIDLDNIESVSCKTFLRILFFLCTPLMPVAIILRAVRLSVKKEDIIAEWIENQKQMSISRAWRLYNMLTSAKNKVMVAYSDLRMVEASTEAVFQMFTLIVFITASILHPEKSGLGLLKNDSWYEYVFLILSLLTSYATIMLSILTSMKIRKKGNLSFWSKVLLGASFSLQLASRFLLMVPTAILALPPFTYTVNEVSQSHFPEVNPSEFSDVSGISGLVNVKIPSYLVSTSYRRLRRSEGSVENFVASCQVSPEAGPGLTLLASGLLLCLPLMVHWILLAVMYHTTVPSFRLLCKRSRFMHILANTWVTVPVREPRRQVQVHKAREQMMSMLLVIINLVLTAIFTACTIEPTHPWFPSLAEKLGLSWCHSLVGGSEFLVLFGGPALVCHLLGCGALLLYYKTTHPWRELGGEREQHCCGKIGAPGIPLHSERPYWEEKEGVYNVAVFHPEESILQTLQMQPLRRSDETRSDENPKTTVRPSCSTLEHASVSSSPSGLATIKNSFSQDQGQANDGTCRLRRLTEYAFE